MDNIRSKVLHILRGNARLTDEQIAAMLGVTAAEVGAEISALEAEGIIIGFSAIINEEKHDRSAVTAVIELKVSPQIENGYGAIAGKIAQNREVMSVQLMSGGYDLAVTVKCDNFRDVAAFVADRLAVMDGVLSTATHFILQRFKEKGALFPSDADDERSLVSP
ncbi:MAG: Lrp/AsnC family transcriptional regulator [Oscillospiraceae bacterium]|jgi:DNA-binding Lrp family transcriptional regulator|nr:Lrp/AsnC family transcriptional regulator [Oscillospiraceae bacterium]